MCQIESETKLIQIRLKMFGSDSVEGIVEPIGGAFAELNQRPVAVEAEFLNHNMNIRNGGVHVLLNEIMTAHGGNPVVRKVLVGDLFDFNAADLTVVIHRRADKQGMFLGVPINCRIVRTSVNTAIHANDSSKKLARFSLRHGMPYFVANEPSSLVGGPENDRETQSAYTLRLSMKE
ncbi:hypothetical protein [Cohnella terricola]|uniref:hypothetical protein n=1 Tax=Cohnella terricola TaxID=1289167 RepID=UPI001FE8E50D|nr:hypothetical protein [Cohnella terricola]